MSASVTSNADAETLPKRTNSDPPAAIAQSGADPPSAWSQVFASLFTPSWSLGLLLFVSFFLPSYEGCDGKTLHLREMPLGHEFSVGAAYRLFLLTWPFLFGLTVAVGVIVLSWSRDPDRARWLWWSYAVLILTHGLLLCVLIVQSLIENSGKSDDAADSSWRQALGAACWLGGSAALVALLPLTRRRCQNWFHAAMWLQLALAFTAAMYVSIVLPSILFARALLIGGKLAIASSVFLFLATIVARMEGYRVLTRSRGESPAQLSLMSLMLLMSVGGVACAWVGAYVLDIWSV